MKHLFCIMSVALALPLPSALAADICGDLDRLASTAGDFSTLQGAASGDDGWASTLQVTGFDACTIGSYKDKLTFDCDRSGLSHDQMRAQLDDLVATVWQCPNVTTRTVFETKDADITWGYFLGEHQFGISGGQDIFSLDESYALNFHMFEE